MMRKAIINLLSWAAYHVSGGSAYIIYQDKELSKAAERVVAEVAVEIANASSENKHARAYAKLRRLCPNASSRSVGLAIELALS